MQKIKKILFILIFLLLLVGCDTEHSHTSSELLYDETYHYQECLDCHEILLKEEHTFDEGVITTQATSQTKGIVTYSCTGCDYKKEEEYSIEVKEPIIVNVDNLSNHLYLTFNKVAINELYPNEFTIKKTVGLISSKSITKITKIVCHVYGEYDNLTMYGNINNAIIPTTNVVVEEEQTGVEYTYLFDNPVDQFRLLNSSNYDVNVFSMTIYYDGEIKNNELLNNTPGEKELSGQTIFRMDDVNISGVELDPKNPSNFVIKPNGYLSCEGSNPIQDIELVEGSNSITIYSNLLGTGDNIGWNYNASTKKTIYAFNMEKAFKIVNNTDKDITISCLIVHYIVEQEDSKVISISKANEIGKALSSSKGVTSTTYQIKGLITEVNGKEIKIVGDDTIYAYMDETPEHMYMGYNVTIEGIIQNYYGKIEIINYTVIDYVSTTYSVGIDEVDNGSLSVDKDQNLNWGDKITITVIPDEGYQLVSISVNDVTQNVENNQCVFTVTSDLEITAKFQLINSDVKETSKTYTISEYPKGVQYAVNEIHNLDTKVSIETSLCHFTTELRIYSSNKNNGTAILHSLDDLKIVTINAGYSNDTLNIYSSSNGVDYQLLTTVNTVSTYKNYDIEISESNCHYLKFDVVGTNQVRIQALTIVANTIIEDKPIEVETIELGFTSLTMIVNTKRTITPIVTPNNADDKTLSFYSSNTDIATISNEGLIEALQVGKVTIEVAAKNKVQTSFELTIEEESISTDEDFFTIFNIEMMGTYGDSNLIKYGDFDILVDGGTKSDTSYIQKILEENVEDHVLEYLIISHPDTDHYEGLMSLVALSSIEEIDNVITNGNTDNSIILNVLKSKYSQTNYQVITDLVNINDKIYSVEVGEEFSLNFYYQDNYLNASSNKNNQSIVSTVDYQETIVFLAGDLESNGCSSVMKYYPNLTTEDDYVIYKALHHGSKGTNSAEFLKYIKPDMCFISAGMRLTEPNFTANYGSHPYIEAVARMGDETKEVYWSGICGTIEITCNGEESICKGSGRSKDYYYSLKTNSSNYIKASIEEEKNCTYFESAFYIMAMSYLGYPDYANRNLLYLPSKKIDN